MSVRRTANARLTLLRCCETCGKAIVTTADTPFIRQIPKGVKRQATVYFCSESCKRASYKHLFDGKEKERRRAREAARDHTEKNKKYYAAHAEERREAARAYRKLHPGAAAADSAYSRRKRKLLEEEAESA